MNRKKIVAAGLVLMLLVGCGTASAGDAGSTADSEAGVGNVPENTQVPGQPDGTVEGSLEREMRQASLAR